MIHPRGSKLERFCGTSRVKFTVGFKAEEIISGGIDGGEGGVDDHPPFCFRSIFDGEKGFFPFTYLPSRGFLVFFFFFCERREFQSIRKYAGKIRGKPREIVKRTRRWESRYEVIPRIPLCVCISGRFFLFLSFSFFPLDSSYLSTG